MNRIQILPSEIYNKISAGEVIERPANVVKELVENSIDAKATNIVIEIVGGGIDKISISDNGSGINENDIEKAVLNHATSKISKADDLYNINTLGFRGEALASICSVSDVTICTKTAKSDFGIRATFENGVLKQKQSVGMADGTTIEVNKLFKYVPARLKFLKKQKSEEQEIYNTVCKFVLSNYNIKFKLIIDNKIKIDYFGSTLSDAILEIYGREVNSNLILLDYMHNNIKVSGYVGTPKIAKPSKINQVIFVNNRYVTNQTISFGVERVFESYLMKGMHPFFCIFVNIESNLIDVNVHPKKLEVRFSDPTKVFSAVYGAVNNAILAFSAKSDLKNNANEVLNLENNFVQPETVVKVYSPSDLNVENTLSPKNENKPQLNLSDFETKANLFCGSEIKVASSQTSFKDFLENNFSNESINFGPKNLEPQINILGQIFNEFCLVTKENTLYLIDEHAMHERLLYDKFVDETKNEKLGTTEFLEPFLLTVSPSEESILIKMEDELKSLGFTISNYYKNTYRVDAIPTILSELNLKTFFSKVLSSEFVIKDKASLLKAKLAREACRGAVKAGQSLSTFEIENLIKNLKKGTPLLCPHGRPVVIELTKLDLEKLFKRKL